MARQKAISVKIATPKVIKALETKLDQIKKDKANQKTNEEKYQKAVEKWNKEVGKVAKSLRQKIYESMFATMAW